MNAGDRVRKKSGKPFKSTFKVNTVRGIVVNVHTNKPAFTFVEDDSVVDCDKCVLSED
jgi:hypothetical protein